MKLNSLENVLDRSVPPKPGKPKAINFPDFFETKGPGGITVVVIEDRKLPLVTARFVFRTGSYYDNLFGADKSGLASVTAEMLSKGTDSRTATMIAEEADFLGATLSAGADFDASYVSCYSLTKHFDSIFDIVSDVILNPKFAEDELQRVKEQRLNTLLALKDEGDYLASRAYKQKVFGSNPLANSVEGVSNSVSSFETEDLRRFYLDSYHPENLIAAFVGDISPDEALKKLEEKFGGWKGNTGIIKNFELPMLNAPSVVMTKKEGAVQSSLRVGHVSINREHPDFIKVSVMNTIYGGYFTSRINRNLREEHGFTYSARSVLSSNRYGGDLSVLTEVKTDITGDTVREILIEMNKLRDICPEPDELQSVKNYISGNFPLQLETPNAVATKAINLKLYGLKKDYYNKYIQTVNSLTAEDIMETARKYLHPDNLVISVSGDTEKIPQQLSGYGEIEGMEI